MTGPLSVLQVGAFPFPLHQGSQVYLRGLSGALARAGHRVTVACWAGGEGAVPPGVDVVRTRPIRGAVHRSGPHWSRLPQDLALIGVVRRVLADVPVDVIHAHNVEAPLAASLARLGRRVPLVYDQHTRMSQELPTYLRRGRRVAGRLGALVDRVVPRLCDGAVALSPAGADALRAQGIRRVALLPPAVDPTDLEGADPARARARWDLGDGPWVAYCGNTDAYQDLPVWFDAMARVPDAGMLLVTADDTAPWEALADALGIASSRRRFVRSAAFADARDALVAASLAVSPRAVCAGFPVKLLNHAGLGVPTVAAAGSARADLGVVAFPNGDAAAMAAAIRSLLADSPRRRALGGAARAEVLHAWTWDARVPDLVAFYRELRRPADG